MYTKAINNIIQNIAIPVINANVNKNCINFIIDPLNLCNYDITNKNAMQALR